MAADMTDFPLLKGDFFPYADNADNFWTGYYTTRPSLKDIKDSRIVFVSTPSIPRATELVMAVARAQLEPNIWLERSHEAMTITRRDVALFLHR
jgi:alpha-mannosidase II